MKIKDLRVAGEKLGRQGMSKLAQKYIANYDGSYKGAMKLCGELSLIAKMATCDDYWSEQVWRGISPAEFDIELFIVGISDLGISKND